MASAGSVKLKTAAMAKSLLIMARKNRNIRRQEKIGGGRIWGRRKASIWRRVFGEALSAYRTGGSVCMALATRRRRSWYIHQRWRKTVLSFRRASNGWTIFLHARCRARVRCAHLRLCVRVLDIWRAIFFQHCKSTCRLVSAVASSRCTSWMTLWARHMLPRTLCLPLASNARRRCFRRGASW